MDKDNFLKKYADHLNEEQKQAVQTIAGPVLLLAVPGSGKTTVLVTRLGYMILCENINPQNILVLTYTVAATRDMGDRFSHVFGEEARKNLEFRTINGICSKIISQYAYMIGKTPDSIYQLITDEKVTTKIVGDILKDFMEDFPTESQIKATKTL
ncbi:MAG: UvrD-helicase domain-containing protein, partial [Lachnospiraceae bacterium]|nr:UvrD-helicase domain-containing protein [Lachnospiraceae bacterium]